MAGYVYVMSKRHLPGLVKIGRTEHHPTASDTELSRPTGVPAEFRL